MTSLDPQQRQKILTPAVRRIIDALKAEGEARIVGGAVRDVVMGRETGDIDLACTLPPSRVMEILAAHQIKTVPTGLAHGTITAVIDHVGYEITTLRRDVATDGRHATVAFTDDWRADAARRDFTFNALYADSSGAVYDYFDGVAAARSGHVCFIGDAETRIREDVLRILRFFRFYGWFGQGGADNDALNACRKRADLIPTLSAERVAREILKLLAAPDPLLAWQLMIDNNIIDFFAPQAQDTTRLRRLLANESETKAKPNALTRLAALLPQDESVAARLAATLKFANRDAEALVTLAKLPALLAADMSRLALRRLIYAYGAEACRAALLLTEKPDAALWPVINEWENPIFPLKGEDIVKRGIPAGPRVGEILRAVEQEWIAADFQPDRQACLDQVIKYGKNP